MRTVSRRHFQYLNQIVTYKLCRVLQAVLGFAWWLQTDAACQGIFSVSVPVQDLEVPHLSGATRLVAVHGSFTFMDTPLGWRCGFRILSGCTDL